MAKIIVILFTVLLIPYAHTDNSAHTTGIKAGQNEEPTPSEKKGYLVIEHEAYDPANEKYMKQYSKVASPLLAEYGGNFIIGLHSAIRFKSLQGNWNPESFSVIEFPSYEKAEAFYYSKAYQSVLPIRLKTYKKPTKEILIEGL